MHGTSCNLSKATELIQQETGCGIQRARSDLRSLLADGTIEAAGRVAGDGSYHAEGPTFVPRPIGMTVEQRIAASGAEWAGSVFDWDRSTITFGRQTVSGVSIDTRRLMEWLRLTTPPQMASSPAPIKSGRKPAYNWEEMYFEMINIADLDGLPEEEGEAVEIMTEWSSGCWEPAPDERSVRTYVSKVYQYLAKARAKPLPGRD